MIPTHQIQKCDRCKVEYVGVHRCAKPFDWQDVEKELTEPEQPKPEQPKPQTVKQAIEGVPEGKEIELIHKPFIAWLKACNIPYVNHRSDVRSGIERGFADFGLFLKGRCIFIECKTAKGKLSHHQEGWHLKMAYAKNDAFVCRSAEECIALSENFVEMTKNL